MGGVSVLSWSTSSGKRRLFFVGEGALSSPSSLCLNKVQTILGECNFLLLKNRKNKIAYRNVFCLDHYLRHRHNMRRFKECQTTTAKHNAEPEKSGKHSPHTHHFRHCHDMRGFRKTCETDHRRTHHMMFVIATA